MAQRDEYGRGQKQQTWPPAHPSCLSTKSVRSLPTPIYTNPPARLPLPAPRTPHGPLPAQHPLAHLRQHPPNNARDSNPPRHPTRRRRPRALALRALPPPRAARKQPHSRLFRRLPALQRRRVPRDARFGVAVSLRCARPAQVLLRNRLLLPHARLGGQCADEPEALPLAPEPGRGRARREPGQREAAYEYL